MRTTRYRYICIWAMAVLFALQACKDEEDSTSTDTVMHDTTPYVLDVGSFPDPILPEDNPLTVQGVELGRMLFYEPGLSGDGTMSCASCHRQEDAFTDTSRFSLGIRGMEGKRQAMSVFNMAWHSNEFFWDGRAHLLRDQSLMPIQDALEMDESLDNVVAKLSELKPYRDQFMRAFGSEEITTHKISLAMEQFMFSIVSNRSKYDRYLAGEVQLSESEERGRRLFFTEYNPFFPDSSGADCAHCHGGLNFENDMYMNNGLNSDSEVQDEGRQKVSGDPVDRGKFKVMSLRNIELTAPYMHDGRFATLAEVIDHYDHGLKASATLDPALEQTREKGLMLSETDKADLIAFLKTLTDPGLAVNPAYASPF